MKKSSSQYLARKALRGVLFQIRTTAKLHLLQGGACDKVRMAVLRKAPVVLGDLCPGSRIYFWVPAVNKGRRQEDPCIYGWGSATLVARRGSNRHYIAYRANILLVAREQMRDATSMEAAAVDHIAGEMELVSQYEDNTYHDIADDRCDPSGGV